MTRGFEALDIPELRAAAAAAQPAPTAEPSAAAPSAAPRADLTSLLVPATLPARPARQTPTVHNTGICVIPAPPV